MKKYTIILIAIVFGINTFGQFDDDNDEFKTVLGEININEIRGFGGPFMTFTTIDGEFAHMMGGGGGIILNEQFIFGGFGGGITNTISAEKTINNVSEYSNLDIDFGYGGLWFGYIFKGNAPIHPVIHTQIGWGGLSLVEDLDNDHNVYHSDNLFIVNPIVELEMNITQFFRLAVGANYRLGFGVNKIDGFNNNSVSGPGGFLSFKFGWF